GICNNFNTTVRSFNWDRPSCHWVSWKNPKQYGSLDVCWKNPKQYGSLDIRKNKGSNTTLLGKHVWEFIHNQDKLCMKLLSSKYLKGDPILHANSKLGASYTWQFIMKIVHSTETDFKVRIWEGNVSLWYDNWLDDSPLCTRVDYVHIHDSQLLCWNKLATNTPYDICLQMQSVFLSSLMEDEVVCGAIILAFILLRMPTSGLLMNPLLYLPASIICGLAHETQLHALHDCYKPKRIWMLLHDKLTQDFSLKMKKLGFVTMSKVLLWVIGFNGSYGTTTSLNIELMTIHHGLELAWNDEIRNIICQSNSQLVGQMVSRGVHYLHPYAPLVNHIRSLVALRI
ncbi:hypothetical protein CR513_41352, partial [Mucuna pruriens]